MGMRAGKMRYGDSVARILLAGGKLPQQSVPSEDGLSSRLVEKPVPVVLQESDIKAEALSAEAILQRAHDEEAWE